ncbi:MAG TPA: glycosyltransferase family 2 protein [Anaeromyxobacteraceae bacterium]|nr:glycosyltransferase family 2 protein [Anaeromyxobacteraceae bacterium]
MTLPDALWLAAAGGAAVAWIRLAWLVLRTHRALGRLDLISPAGAAPSLSAVVPCRDEARGVEAAVRSLLSQDVPDLEVVAVDDRSTDGTGAILDRLAREDGRLRVVHVEELPTAWLGKNHACHVGGLRARGDWILFTDGDVLFAPGALRRALAYARALGVGHLVALPRLVAPGLWERAFVTFFAAVGSAALRLFELSRPGTRGFAGVGAFNLVRRDAWRAVGGHERLALEVVDDVKLGLLLRRSGVPQAAVLSAGLVAVRWQHGFFPSVLGLVKNAFAAAEYRPLVSAVSSVGLAFLGVAPLAALLLASFAPARALGLAGLALGVGVHAAVARRTAATSGLEGLLHPACALLLAGALAASAVAASARGAVVWRGTRYPLDRLRAGCLRMAALPPSGAPGWAPAPGGSGTAGEHRP